MYEETKVLEMILETCVFVLFGMVMKETRFSLDHAKQAYYVIVKRRLFKKNNEKSSFDDVDSCFHHFIQGVCFENLIEGSVKQLFL